MNKFLTTVFLALVTLAAIWGGFWLTNNRSADTSVNMLNNAGTNVAAGTMEAGKMAAGAVGAGAAGAMGAAADAAKAGAAGAVAATDAAKAGAAGAVAAADAAKAGAVGAMAAADAAKAGAAGAVGAAANAVNNLTAEAEKLGVSHAQAMLLPNLGNGWHVVSKTEKPNAVKIQEAKTGLQYIAQSDRIGNTKHTTLMNIETGAKVKEFTAPIQ
jgi:hypothetical protein